jgi:hypothetical protein
MKRETGDQIEIINAETDLRTAQDQLYKFYVSPRSLQS